MSLPTFSVIVPTVGNLEFLRRSVLSVRNQTLQDWECLVVVDAPDAVAGVSEWIATLRDPRIRVIGQARQRGVGSARNAGAEAARAPLLALLDDDDFWFPEKLARHLAVHEASPEVGLVYSDSISWWTDERLPACRHYSRRAPDDPPFKAIASLQLPICSPSCVSVRASAYLESQGFSPDIAVAEDVDFYLRVGRRWVFRYLREALTVYSQHPTGSMSTQGRKLPAFQQMADAHGFAGSQRRLFVSANTAFHVKAMMSITGAWNRLKAAPGMAVDCVALNGIRGIGPALKLGLIAILPWAFYRLWFSRNCRREDGPAVTQLLGLLTDGVPKTGAAEGTGVF